MLDCEDKKVEQEQEKDTVFDLGEVYEERVIPVPVDPTDPMAMLAAMALASSVKK